MPTNAEHRAAAESRVNELIATLEGQPASPGRDALIDECRSLARALAAFHMEGIRFRMYNVDRVVAKGAVSLPEPALALFADARRHLEAAGFQTRSHQAPSTT